MTAHLPKVKSKRNPLVRSVPNSFRKIVEIEEKSIRVTLICMSADFLGKVKTF